jgi:tetratricopeptide (TPR) repeat protein
MEHLDLNAHDPEEYEGKAVTRKECEYVVGEHLGSGAERIVHKLINRASGLCLHVLKVWRSPDLGYVPSLVRAELASDRGSEIDFADLIPVSIEIELPGGRAEMQIYAGGLGDDCTRADTLTDKGDELFKNSRFGEAITSYGEALVENPNHTHALVNLAAARAAEGDLEGAYQAAARATAIEPNYPLYRRALIHYLRVQGLARLALGAFHSAREDFPNVCDFNDLGASLLVACGEPELALTCAQDCVLASADKDKLLATIRVAVEARSRAQVLMDEARSLAQHADAFRVLALLEKARAFDESNPLLAGNLALTLARVGRCREAVPLLLHAATHGPFHWAKVFYANVAFCLMKEGELPAAMVFLGTTMSQIDMELQGRQLKNLAADLPGRGIWVDEQAIFEEKVESAARLVVQSAQTYEKSSTMPAEAANLARLYSKVL